MSQITSLRRMITAGGVCLVILGSWTFLKTVSPEATASPPWFGWGNHHPAPCLSGEDCQVSQQIGGTWYWMRSPDEEKRVVAGLFNRYCIRCHGVDGRGVWDIPGVPDFTNTRWQALRSDADISRIILEGRGAVMPPFRGTMTLEESWAMARYLRTFVPGTEASRPDLGSSKNTENGTDKTKKTEKEPDKSK